MKGHWNVLDVVSEMSLVTARLPVSKGMLQALFEEESVLGEMEDGSCKSHSIVRDIGLALLLWGRLPVILYIRAW